MNSIINQSKYKLFIKSINRTIKFIHLVCSNSENKHQSINQSMYRLINSCQWNLVCDLRWMKATITSVQFGGVLTGAILGGQSGDYFGRKKTIYGAYLLHAVLNVIAAFSTSWQMFAVMRFLIGIMIGRTLVHFTG